MKKTSLHLFAAAAGLTALATLTSASAQTQASSKPMGYVTYNALGNSDTVISLSIERKSAFVGKVASVTGANEIVVQGSPGWTAGDFVYSVGVQPDTFYVMIASGNLEGRHFEVTANSANSLTLDLGGETITGAGNVEANTSVKVTPYWTLNTVFAEGGGVNASSSHFNRNSEILLPDVTTAGVNLSAAATYYYYSGTLNGGEGWRLFGGGFANKFDDQPLSKDVPLTIRHNIATATTMTNLGDVPTTSYRSPLNRITAGVKQDNSVALSIPLEMTLMASNLFESGAFEGGTSHFNRKDELLVFDNLAAAKNKSASATYYYFTGTLNGGPGWRRFGGGLTNIVNSDVVFGLDKSVVIRRASGPAGSAVWHAPLPYAP